MTAIIFIFFYLLETVDLYHLISVLPGSLFICSKMRGSWIRIPPERHVEIVFTPA